MLCEMAIKPLQSERVLFPMTTLTYCHEPLYRFSPDVSRGVTLVVDLTCSHAAIDAPIAVTLQHQRSFSLPVV